MSVAVDTIGSEFYLFPIQLRKPTARDIRHKCGDERNCPLPIKRCASETHRSRRKKLRR